MAERQLIDEVIEQDGGEVRQPGMLTPAEIEAIENAEAERLRAGGEPRKENEEAPPEKKPGAGSGTDDLIDYDALLKKVEDNPDLSTLTDDEKAQLQVIRKDLEDAGPETTDQDTTTYNIGGKVYTAAEIDAKIREEALGEVDIAPERMKKFREWYVGKSNKTEQSRANQRVSEVNAADRQVLLQAKLAEQQRVDRLKADRERIKRDRELAKAKANLGITAEQLKDENGGVNVENLLKYQSQQAATEQLARLEQDETQIEEGIKAGEMAILATEINALLALAPQYKMPVDVFTAFKTISEGGTLDQDTEMKVLDLDDMLRTARSKGIPLEKEYAYRAAKGTLAVRPAAQPAGPGRPSRPELPNNAKSIQEMIRRHNKLRTAAPPGGGGGGGAARPGGEQRSTASRLVEHDRTLLEGKRDEFLKELKY